MLHRAMCGCCNGKGGLRKNLREAATQTDTTPVTMAGV